MARDHKTHYGYKKIEDIKEGDLISTLHPNGFEPVKKIEKHDDIEIFHVIFTDGGEQFVTAAHIYHTQRKNSNKKFIEKIRLDELKIGDSIQVEPIKFKNTNIETETYEKGYIYIRSIIR